MSGFGRSLQIAAAGILTLAAAPALPFTADQAAAGRASFEQNCAACHGADLQVLRTAQLAGPEFMGRWQNRTTGELLSQLRATMPPKSGRPAVKVLGVPKVATPDSPVGRCSKRQRPWASVWARAIMRLPKGFR